MLRIIIAILLLFIFMNPGFSQNVEFKPGNFKDSKEGLKSAQANLDAGNKFFKEGFALLEEGKNAFLSFKKALEPFQKANEFNPSNAELNYKIGKCLVQVNRLVEAIPYLRKSISLDEKNVEPETYYLLGRSLKLENNWDEAKQMIAKYKTVERSKILEKNQDEISRELSQCDIAKAFINKPEDRVWVENIKEWNSEYDDYNPAITADEATLMFNSKRPGEHPGMKDDYDQYPGQVFITNKEKGKWSELKLFGNPFNTPGEYEACSFSFDGQKMFLSKPLPKADIYESDLEGEQWTPPLKLSEKINSPDNETFACFSLDGIRVYYVTDQAYGNRGGKDLFFSGVMNRRTNTWGQGMTIGSEINTPQDEGFIYFHPDDKTIYFSSKGHNSMGGYDIFKSTRLAGRWSEPVNLGYPINTPYDETSFVLSASGKHAYLTSNRPGGKGGFDLYKVTFLGPLKEPVMDIEDQLLASIAAPQKDDKLEGAVHTDTQKLTVMKGRVLDDFTSEPLKADIEIVDNVKNEVINTVKTNSKSGKYLISLPSGKNYGIAVRAPDYLFHSENFNLPDTSDFQLVEKDIRLVGTCIGCKIILKNIFFDTGKFALRPESNNELNRLIDLIKEITRVKPNIKVEISGHTDNVGSEASNMLLSENRAKAVVTYLVEHGINAAKLVFKGYGPSQPVATNNTPQGRQENRRTEFKIIE